MKRCYCLLIILTVWSLFFTGCVATTNRMEMHYGTSFYLAKFNQTLNPEADKNPEPVYGLDSEAALKLIEKYRKGFEKPAPAPTYTFNISTGK